MIVRKAEQTDIPQILSLLKEVLNVHAEIRPDIFIKDTTKYTKTELCEIIKNENTPVFVAVKDETVLGYCFCEIKNPIASNNMKPVKTLYIDDLCVTAAARHGGIGKALTEYVFNFAKEQKCYNVTLNVWAGNIAAENFYNKMGFTPKKTEMEIIL